MISNNNFIYSLRYCVQPGFNEEEKLNNLLEFCKLAKIDDVMFFINPEELFCGHLTIDELSVWIKTIQKFSSEINKLGITYSLNPWSTLGHADRGRMLNPKLNFDLMVDKNGKSSTSIACPICEHFISYITQIFEVLAETKPNIIWIEDDLRLHNHLPLEWGGCFCDKHMNEYRKLLGYDITREDFVKEILNPNENNECRKIWLDVSNNSIINLATKIKEAVLKVSPNTKIGLMSSIPSVHCAEGRDWLTLLNSIKNKNHIAAARPHMPAYSESVASKYMFDFNTITLNTIFNYPNNIEIYPELESMPHTLFSKSKKFTELQLYNSLILNSNGITLNIFDMMGNGVNFYDKYDEVLSINKSYLNQISSLNFNISDLNGVKVMFSPRSSYSLKTQIGKSISELYPMENWIAGILSAFGIPISYELNEEIGNHTIAISGQYFRNLTPSKIESLLKNNKVILDGDAVFTLVDMGLGNLLNIASAEYVDCDTNFAVMEQVRTPNKFYGLSNARMTMQNIDGSFLNIKYDAIPYIITDAVNSRGESVANGSVIVNNKIFIIPYGKFNTNPMKLFDISIPLLNPIRQQMIQDFMKKCDNIPYVLSNPFIYCYHYIRNNEELLYIVNSNNDTINDLTLHWDIHNPSCIKVLKQHDSELSNIEYNDNIVKLIGNLKSLETAAIYIQY